MNSLKDDSKKILSRTDLSATQLEEIKSRSETQQQQWHDISIGLGMHEIVEENENCGGECIVCIFDKNETLVVICVQRISNSI